LDYELAATNLTFAYPKQAPLFTDATLAVPKGHILVLLGPNGVGKSTLLGCLTGRLQPSAGQVQVAGVDLATLTARQRATRLAIVAQSGRHRSTLSVQDYLLLGRVAHHGVFGQPDAADRQCVAAALARVGMGDYAAASVATLSGGQRQLVMIAAALVQAAQVVVLDEPTAALDLKNQRLVMQLLKALKHDGKTIVVTTHDPNQATLIADSIAIIQHQQVVQLATSELSATRLSAIYQTPIAVTQYGQRRVFLIEGVEELCSKSQF
jgi:iron complex transport system ATP-binding protein